jgi:hypothetical protein
LFLGNFWLSGNALDLYVGGACPETRATDFPDRFSVAFLRPSRQMPRQKLA